MYDATNLDEGKGPRHEVIYDVEIKAEGQLDGPEGDRADDLG